MKEFLEWLKAFFFGRSADTRANPKKRDQPDSKTGAAEDERRIGDAEPDSVPRARNG